MKIQGFSVAENHLAAGIAAMVGEFTAQDVRRALSRAGLIAPEGTNYWLERVADRLMQSERRAGRIEAVDNKNWRRL